MFNSGIDAAGSAMSSGFDYLLEQAGSSSSPPPVPASWGGPFTKESPPTPEQMSLFEGIMGFLESTGKATVERKSDSVKKEIQDNADQQTKNVKPSKKNKTSPESQ